MKTSLYGIDIKHYQSLYINHEELVAKYHNGKYEEMVFVATQNRPNELDLIKLTLLNKNYFKYTYEKNTIYNVKVVLKYIDETLSKTLKVMDILTEILEKHGVRLQGDDSGMIDIFETKTGYYKTFGNYEIDWIWSDE